MLQDSAGCHCCKHKGAGRLVKVCTLTLKNRMPQKVLTIGFACTMSDAAYPAVQILP